MLPESIRSPTRKERRYPAVERSRSKEKAEKDAASIRSQSRPERRASKMRFSWLKPKPKPENVAPPMAEHKPEQHKQNGNAEPEPKKMPVFFIDEAHKL